MYDFILYKSDIGSEFMELSLKPLAISSGRKNFISTGGNLLLDQAHMEGDPPSDEQPSKGGAERVERGKEHTHMS